jgi:hypothetical protein
VNTRAGITSCQAGGEVAFAAPNNNGASVAVSYKVKYNRPVLGVDAWDATWSDYSAPVPANATQIAVQATVTVAANGIAYSDPGQGGPIACSP